MTEVGPERRLNPFEIELWVRTDGARLMWGHRPARGPRYAATAGAGSYASTGPSHRSTVSTGTPFRPA